MKIPSCQLLPSSVVFVVTLRVDVVGRPAARAAYARPSRSSRLWSGAATGSVVLASTVSSSWCHTSTTAPHHRPSS